MKAIPAHDLLPFRKRVIPDIPAANKRILRWFFIAALSLTVLGLAGGYWFGLRLNGTASFPLGVWRLTHKVPQKGDIVIFRPALDNETIKWAYETGILSSWGHSGSTMLKRVVAVEGDTIELKDVVLVNGAQVPHSRIFRIDQAGRTIPTTATPGQIPAGKVWLMSDYNDRSFDSRYFGSVSLDAIDGVATPVFTW